MTASPSIPRLHPKLLAMREEGGFLDVEPCDMHLDVGKNCMILTPRSRRDQGVHEIVSVECWDGQLFYRIVGDCNPDRMGQTVTPAEIRLL